MPERQLGPEFRPDYYFLVGPEPQGKGLGPESMRSQWGGLVLPVTDMSHIQRAHKGPELRPTIEITEVWVDAVDGLRALEAASRDSLSGYLRTALGYRADNVSTYFVFPVADGELRDSRTQEIVESLPLPSLTTFYQSR